MTDAAIHRISRKAVDLSVRLRVHSGSPRAFSPRDDKSETESFFAHILNHTLFVIARRERK